MSELQKKIELELKLSIVYLVELASYYSQLVILARNIFMVQCIIIATVYIIVDLSTFIV